MNAEWVSGGDLWRNVTALISVAAFVTMLRPVWLCSSTWGAAGMHPPVNLLLETIDPAT